MFRIFYGVAIILLVVSCKKKEKTVEVEKDVIVYQDPVYKWKSVLSFGDNGFIKNVHRAGAGFIFFTGIYDDAVYDSITDKFYSLQGAERDIQLKPLLTDAYKLELYQNGLNIVPHNNLPNYPVSYSEKQIYIPALDSSFNNFYFGSTIFEGEITGNKNTLLLTYNTKRSYGMSFMAIKLNFDLSMLNSGSSYILLDKVKIYRDSLFIGSDRFIGPIGDNVLFMMGNGKNYLLNANLDTVYINNTCFFNDLFHYKNSTYSVIGKTLASGVSGGQTCLVKTMDNGLTWQDVACGLSDDFQNLSYVEIGDKLIAYSFGNNQLWEITLTDNSLSAKELVNDGLTNKRIKGINMCNNRVFISTESGVFERPFKEFIEYK